MYCLWYSIRPWMHLLDCSEYMQGLRSSLCASDHWKTFCTNDISCWCTSATAETHDKLAINLLLLARLALCMHNLGPLGTSWDVIYNSILGLLNTLPCAKQHPWLCCIKVLSRGHRAGKLVSWSLMNNWYSRPYTLLGFNAGTKILVPLGQLLQWYQFQCNSVYLYASCGNWCTGALQLRYSCNEVFPVFLEWKMGIYISFCNTIAACKP